MHHPRRAPSKPISPRAGSRRSRRKSLAEHHRACALGTALVLMSALAGNATADNGLRPYTVVDDAIPQSLTGAKGDAERGRAIVANRQLGLCLLCHSGPFPEEKF